jgi:hypothetical protein
MMMFSPIILAKPSSGNGQIYHDYLSAPDKNSMPILLIGGSPALHHVEHSQTHNPDSTVISAVWPPRDKPRFRASLLRSALFANPEVGWHLIACRVDLPYILCQCVGLRSQRWG